MIETIIKSNTARIVQLEGDVRSLAVTLERVSTEQKHQTELLQTIQEATTQTPDGWIKQAITPQTVLIVVVFFSSVLGVNLVWPGAAPATPAVNVSAGK
tara:strand:+ start:431 stop:727 length:297 start_codon:yes stop_codon:yes gene_type:complete